MRFLVGFSTGGGTDTVARAVSVRLSESLGQQVVVDNRPGANGNIAAEIAAKAPPDGYTVLLISVSHAIGKPFYRKLAYDLERDFVPLMNMASVPHLVVVHPSLPVKTLKDLVALAKARPGQMSYASSGMGSPEQISGEILKSMTGIQMVHVPYKGGGPAAVDLVAGQVAVGFNTLPAAIPHIRNGRIKTLAVTDEKRSAALPDVPTSAEAGFPGYTMTNWFGGVLAVGTPKEIIVRLNSEMAKILQMPDVKERLAAVGADAVGGTPESFGALIKSEIAKYAKVVRDGGLQLD